MAEDCQFIKNYVNIVGYKLHAASVVADYVLPLRLIFVGQPASNGIITLMSSLSSVNASVVATVHAGFRQSLACSNWFENTCIWAEQNIHLKHRCGLKQLHLDMRRVATAI